MRQLHILLFYLTIFSLFIPSETVTCYADSDISSNKTCQGDFCTALLTTQYNYRAFRTCVTGASIPSTRCQIGYSDEMVCYCDTDFCNNDKLFDSNYTTLPIIECKTIKLKTYVAAAANKCVRLIEYFASVDRQPSLYLHEYVEVDQGKASTDFIFDKDYINHELIYRNFFSDACYNFSMHPAHYVIYCRCTQANCNTPESTSLPYPISESTVTCYTGGLDDDYDSGKYSDEDGKTAYEYQRMRENDSYIEEGGQCHGHFCFIARITSFRDTFWHYKGCISANEQGEHKIRLGYTYLNYVDFYICDTDFCNSDIETALEEARNSTKTVKDNEAANLGFSGIWTFLVILIVSLC